MRKHPLCFAIKNTTDSSRPLKKWPRTVLCVNKGN